MSLKKVFIITEKLNSNQLYYLKKFILSRVGEDTDVFALLQIAIECKLSKKLDVSIDQLMNLYEFQQPKKLVLNNFSILYEMIEDFVAIEQMKEENFLKEKLAQKWMNSNELYSIADQIAHKILEKNKSMERLSFEYQKVNFEILYEQLFSSNPAKYDFKSNDFLEMINAFIEYFYSQNLNLMTEMENRNQLHHNISPELLKVLGLIYKLPLNKEKFYILDLVYKMMANDDFEAFLLLKDLLLKGKINTDRHMTMIITSYIVNRSRKFWSSGILTEKKVMHKLVLYGLDKGIYFSNGKLSTATFHNLVGQLAPFTGQKAMIEFIDKWIKKVFTESQDATYNLSLAQVDFYNERYKTIPPLVWRKDFNDFNQKNLAQSLFLVSSFMNRKFDQKGYQIALSSSKSFIIRNEKKMSENLAKSYINLFDFMKRIDDSSSFDLSIYDGQPLLYRSWCEKIISNYI